MILSKEIGSSIVPVKSEALCEPIVDFRNKTIQQLRAEGYAIILWTPEELEGVAPKHVEDRSVELGWEIIEALKEFN